MSKHYPDLTSQNPHVKTHNNIKKDFPFYNSSPIEITGKQWLVIVLMTALGFSTLFVPFPTQIGGYLPIILCWLIPLLTLRAIATNGYWKAIFQKIKRTDVLWMFIFAVLNLIITISLGLLVTHFFQTSPNPVNSMIENLHAAEQVLFFIQTGFQIFGEEIITILPFLAILYFTYNHLNCSRKAAVIVAWIITALIFATLHLSTYNWNFLQCFLIIAPARLVLTLAYIKTKNIWVSTGAHIINDWTLFGISMFVVLVK